jgi:cellulose synthase/poly-beta-1,6-N-acetylglucosamine synthase-like glycosyltransferase
MALTSQQRKRTACGRVARSGIVAAVPDDALAMPRVSVITPAHDNAATIEATLRSVVAQTFADWELVVADDASNDATPALVRDFGDPRVRLVRSPTNVGPAGARNLALDHAGGELVAFLDADDRYEPSYLATMIGRLEAEGPGVGIVCCDAWRETPQGEVLGRYSALHGPAEGIDLAGLLLRNRVLIASLCPREVVDEAGGFSTECWGSEDHDLWLRIVEHGHRVAYVDEPLVRYRVAEGSISSSRLRMARTDQATFGRALARGRLDAGQRAIARARLDLAVAAEAAARGVRPRDVPTFARAVRARVVLRRAAGHDAAGARAASASA